VLFFSIAWIDFKKSRRTIELLKTMEIDEQRWKTTENNGKLMKTAGKAKKKQEGQPKK
jgi:hypothetical protein